MKRHAFGSLAASLLLLLALVAGCNDGNPPTAKVEGTVTYQGKPVEGADVSFWATGAPRAGVGKTDAAGKYQISTFGTDDGALIGAHTVTVTKSVSTTGMSAADMTSGKKPATADPLPGKYADATSSPLKTEVKAGAANKFDITLED